MKKSEIGLFQQPVRKGEALRFCKECGKEINDKAAVCVHCGVAAGNSAPLPGNPEAKSEIAYILLGVFLGTLGIHNFYAGYTGKAVAQLLITVLTCGFGSIISFIWAIVEVCTVRQDVRGVRFTKQ